MPPSEHIVAGMNRLVLNRVSQKRITMLSEFVKEFEQYTYAFIFKFRNH